VRAIIRAILAKAGRWRPPNIPRSPSPGSGPGRPAPAGSRPWTAWRSVTTSSAVITSTPDRHAYLAADQGAQPDRDPHLLPRLPGVGVDSAPFRPGPLVRAAAQRGRADRHQPANHRRRSLGETAVSWAEPRARRPARQHRRHLLPDGTDPGITLSWLFSGLRSDELSRLAGGC
jgi:hypothetical protein